MTARSVRAAVARQARRVLDGEAAVGRVEAGRLLGADMASRRLGRALSGVGAAAARSVANIARANA